VPDAVVVARELILDGIFGVGASAEHGGESCFIDNVDDVSIRQFLQAPADAAGFSLGERSVPSLPVRLVAKRHIGIYLIPEIDRP
jgi:hypothetical protein